MNSKDTVFRQAALLYAAGTPAKREKGDFVFGEVSKEQAHKVLLSFLNKNVLEKGTFTGFTHRAEDVTRTELERYNERWRPERYAPGDDSGPSGDWEYDTREVQVYVRTDHHIDFVTPQNGRKPDVSFDETLQKLRISAAAVNPAPFRAALAQDVKAVSALATVASTPAAANSLAQSFAAASGLKPPQAYLGEVDEEKLAQAQQKLAAFREQQKAVIAKLKAGLAAANITPLFRPEELNGIVRRITGQKLNVA